jgi:hypothetical protein
MAPRSSSGPTPEFRRHHRVLEPEISAAAFMPAWRVRSRLDRLLLDGAISVVQWRAAIAYRDTWEAAHRGGMTSNVASLEAGVISKGRHRRPVEPGTARLDAIERLKRIEQHLSPIVVRLVASCVLEDLGWAQVGRRFGCTPKTARSWVVAAVRALAAIW